MAAANVNIAANNLNQVITAIFEDPGVNGDLFNGIGSGELEDQDPECIHWHPLETGTIANIQAPVHQTLNADAKRDYLRMATALNAWYLRTGGFGYSNDPLACMRIAYSRSLLVRDGIADSGAAPATKHCQYTMIHDSEYSLACTRLATRAAVNACVADTIAGNNGVPARRGATRANLTDAEVAAYIGANPASMMVYIPFPAAVSALIRKQLPDLICLTAWFFRVTGHHYSAGCDERLSGVWRGTAHANGEENVGLPWKCVTRGIMKCIFPIDLENYWHRQVDRGICSGPFKNRFTSFPAGSAAYGAVIKGYKDICTIFPMFNERFRDIAADLQQVENIMLSANIMDKMGLSINSRYYGVARVVLDESRISSIASTIRACYDQFTERNPLMESRALERAATGAPVTGAVIGKILLAISNSTDYHRTIMALQ